MPFGEFGDAVGGRWRRGRDRFVVENAADVHAESVGGLVSARAVFLERLHHHPVHLPADHGVAGDRAVLLPLVGDPRARLERLVFPDHPLHFSEAGLAQQRRVERGGAGQQLVEDDPE